MIWSFDTAYREGQDFANARFNAQRAAEKRAKAVMGGVAVACGAMAVNGKLTGKNAAPMIRSAIRKMGEKGRSLLSDGLEVVKDSMSDEILEVYDFLGIEPDDNGLREYLNGVHYGKTFDEREEEYGGRLLFDVAALIAAGKYLELDDARIREEIARSWSDPYNAGSIIFDAKRAGFPFKIPTAVGMSRSGIGSILGNVGDTLAICWEMARFDYEKKRGAIGYYVYRGSTYPCESCDEQTGWLHPMDEEVLPVHNRCRCFMVYVSV